MLLRYSLGREEEARAIEARRRGSPTAGGPATWPIASELHRWLVVVGTTGFTTAVVEALATRAPGWRR